MKTTMINDPASNDLTTQPGEWKLPDRGKVAVIAVIFTEATLFIIFVVAYLYYIGKSLTGPYPAEVLDLPIISTICLLSSSITIVLAEHAFKKGQIGGFRIWWFVTIALAVEFLAGTIYEWHKLIFEDHLTISTNLFGSTYYPLVGLHASHVIVGLILLVLVFVLSLRGHVKSVHTTKLEILSWYWHFVDAVWVVVFTVVYLIGR